MYFPKNRCTISSTTTDVTGKEQVTGTWPEKCAIVAIQISDEKTQVRTDTSATKGNAKELVCDAIILLGKNSKAKMNYVIEVEGYKMIIVGMQPRFNIDGRLDHYEMSANIWNEHQTTGPGNPLPGTPEDDDKWN